MPGSWVIQNEHTWGFGSKRSMSSYVYFFSTQEVGFGGRVADMNHFAD